MDSGLAGKRVLVTGASGGIGAACVRAFMAEGCEVVAHYHGGRERAEALGASSVVGADLRYEAGAERLFEQAGPLDVCAAVAGVWPSEDVPVWELPLERWEETLSANLRATFLTARGFLRGAFSGHVTGQIVTVAGGMEGRSSTNRNGRWQSLRLPPEVVLEKWSGPEYIRRARRPGPPESPVREPQLHLRRGRAASGPVRVGWPPPHRGPSLLRRSAPAALGRSSVAAGVSPSAPCLTNPPFSVDRFTSLPQ